MTQFFQEVVLTEVTEPIVIFVDEIDSTLSLDFTDDFYAAIRYLYVARSTDANLRRLSFVLIGVATPADLIRDPKRTPFNIGQRVDLTDFTAVEARPLVAGLGLPPGQAQRVLDGVMGWTNGHPYLTQRLCRALVEQPSQDWTADGIGEVVSHTFLGEMSEQDNNLQFVRDMLTKRAPQPYEREVLETYQQIYRARQPVRDEEQNLVRSHLKLSGVVRRDGKQLKVRNRIYREVFDWSWIREHLPETWWQRNKSVLQVAIPVTAISLMVAVAMMGLARDRQLQAEEADRQRQIAEANSREAEQQKQVALDNSREADRQKNRAVEQDKIAQQKAGELTVALRREQRTQIQLKQALFNATDARQRAEQQKRLAQQQQQRAEQATQLALQQRKQAEMARRAELIQRQRAEQQTLIAQTQTQEAEQQTAIAEIRAGCARAKNWVNTSNAAIGLTLAMATTARSQRSSLAIYTPTITTATDALLFSLQTAQEHNQLKGHAKSVLSVAFSPDGNRIVSGSRDNTLRIWNANTGQTIGQPLKGHANEVWSVAFSPDGNRIVSGSVDNTLRIWDANTRQTIGQPLKGHADSVLSVAFSPDGNRIVSGSVDNTLRIWPGDWSGFMRLTCERLQHHPLLNAPETVVSEELVQVGWDAKAACDARPWLQTTAQPKEKSWWEQTVQWIAQLWP